MVSLTERDRTGTQGRRFEDPAWAYVPGRTARHPETAFDCYRAGVSPGQSVAALARSDAWCAGLQFLQTGFYWEAHEVLEAVWMAIPDDRTERRYVQAVIQIANAGLKLRMDRPAATLRLCAIAETLILESGAAGQAMGIGPGALTAMVATFRDEANRRLNSP